MSESIFEQLGGILGEIREEAGGKTAFEVELEAARMGSRLGQRRARIQALIERGATEGEREAARRALERTPTHAEVNEMRRAGNHIPESTTIEDLLAGFQQSQGL